MKTKAKSLGLGMTERNVPKVMDGTKQSLHAGIHRGMFKKLWNDTNGKDAWERNDWTFAYTFKLLAEADLTA